MKIRFAVTPPILAFDESIFPQYVEACEALGFDTLWLSDLPLGPLGDPLLSLAFAAVMVLLHWKFQFSLETRQIALAGYLLAAAAYVVWRIVLPLRRPEHGGSPAAGPHPPAG